MLRILLADDHDLMRSGLRYLLEKRTDWQVCCEASNGRDAVQWADELRPDLAILDISMPELNGLDAARQILKNNPKIKILVYTMYESEKLTLDAIEAGVHGLVLKSDAGTDLAAAVDSIAKGKRYFTSRVAETVVGARFAQKSSEGRVSSAVAFLTRREREVVQLLAEGKSNKEVANCLGISTRTAEGHRGEVMRKLRLGSLAGVIRYAIRDGMVQP